MKLTKNNRLIVIVLVCVLVIGAVVGVAVGVNARYRRQSDSGDKQVGAAQFYFGSNVLREGEYATYQMRTTDFNTFVLEGELYNYQDSLNYSGRDITYTIKYSLSTETIFHTLTTGTITGGAARKVTFSLPLSVFQAADLAGNQVVVDIVAESTAPFASSLYGRFTIRRGNNAINLSVATATGTNVARLTVSSRATRTITIQYPADLMPDATDDRMTVDLVAHTITVDVIDNAEYIFVFFKSDPSVSSYTVGDGGFEIVEP